MKKYIKSNDEVSSVWAAIPEKYHPYISEVQINHPYSQYQQKDVTTYSAYFTNEVINYYKDELNSYLVGLIHCEDIASLLLGLEEYLDPIIELDKYGEY